MGQLLAYLIMHSQSAAVVVAAAVAELSTVKDEKDGRLLINNTKVLYNVCFYKTWLSSWLFI